ncbi:homoserine kinase [Alkalihalobacillus alcalophilus ATCC 27647 = CGMCC 1.3604]|uniref:Homoserine kinase n=1 Tax=Alkalihalobacillus alcalophilus ATCC 27647 = CGMCC 1.3604 TaxID=1218173 RepID=A0A094WGE1_ALKAL|nr:homoserine kinase [Alkalihalobacillus alcalophilus]KGA95851.1 serine kinase [Alkalihalobacillus alcalophilus ATCC 27647 = CGMCC 1.3604]MED1563440.1 homoserine kinase [Alkalihalobacillus alcalophilus]THG89311.1 homoserine kinase [Alkalihalobacillus alcalophilus ATCC 27647 = CGMCC 1.3604]
MSRLCFEVTVPGSTANLGPGFDSIGLAVNRYLTLIVEEAKEWHFSSDSVELQGVPVGEDNLICEVAKHVAKERGGELPPCRVEMRSDIPLARGLGSSAAAIVAGVELANQFLETKMSIEEKVRFASLWEGHPDNVSPSIYGGLTIGTHTKEETDVLYGGIPELDLILLIPSEELKTKLARSVLPNNVDFKQAVRGSGVANVLVAAVFQKNWELVGKMMSRDVFHQPYRGELIPHLQKVIDFVQNETVAFGAALSGAGPTMLCLAPIGKGGLVKSALLEQFPSFEIEILQPATEGIQVQQLSEKKKKEIS